MRSLVILEVEHDETTDGVQQLAEWVQRQTRESILWDDVEVTDYTVRIDLPEFFKLGD